MIGLMGVLVANHTITAHALYPWHEDFSVSTGSFLIGVGCKTTFLSASHLHQTVDEVG